jgi:hypothetical protein
VDGDKQNNVVYNLEFTDHPGNASAYDAGTHAKSSSRFTCSIWTGELGIYDSIALANERGWD